MTRRGEVFEASRMGDEECHQRLSNSGREASFHALGALLQINLIGFLETPEKAMPPAPRFEPAWIA